MKGINSGDASKLNKALFSTGKDNVLVYLHVPNEDYDITDIDWANSLYQYAVLM